MRKFILNIALFTLILFCFYAVVFLITPAGSIGLEKGHYVKVSSPQYYSLILGSSMASVGLSPSVVQQSLENYYQFPMMNFAFNIYVSPYGETYFSRIAEKVKKNENKNSLFLISVDPYTIGNYETNGRREENRILAQLKSVTSQPNWEYFLKYSFLTKQFVTLRQKMDSDKYGFVASSLNMEIDTENEVRERIETFMTPWYKEDVIPFYRISEERLFYLAKIIDLLKENGDVFLIRMPFEFEIFEMTDSIYPNFDNDMQAIAEKHGIHYISFWTNPSNYRTTDGVHLYKVEAERISKDISDSIRIIKSLEILK